MYRVRRSDADAQRSASGVVYRSQRAPVALCRALRYSRTSFVRGVRAEERARGGGGRSGGELASSVSGRGPAAGGTLAGAWASRLQMTASAAALAASLLLD